MGHFIRQSLFRYIWIRFHFGSTAGLRILFLLVVLILGRDIVRPWERSHSVRDFVYNVFCFIIIDVGIDMEVYTTDNEVRTVTTAAEEFALFFSHTLELIQECEQHLLESPSHFKQVEQRLSHAFKQGAGTICS